MSKKLDILYEDNHLLIVNKPSGVLVQRDKEGLEESMEDYAKSYIKYNEKKAGNVFLGIPHRIDRPTSGIVILCKSSKALTRINQMFQDKKIRKTYWAVIPLGTIEERGHWTHYLLRSEKQNKTSVSATPKPEYKKSELKYKIVSKSTNYQLVEVELLTGRHHQIRAQFSFMGFPIKGDNKYGAKRGNEDLSIDLHSRYLKLIHPVTLEKIELTAPTRQNAIWKELTKSFMIFDSKNSPSSYSLIIESRNGYRISLTKKGIVIRAPKFVSEVERNHVILDLLKKFQEKIDAKPKKNTLNICRDIPFEILGLKTVITSIVSNNNNNFSLTNAMYSFNIKTSIEPKKIQLFHRIIIDNFTNQMADRVAIINKSTLNEAYNTIQIKNVLSKWGSCSSKRHLVFSSKLMLMPLWVIDYVIIHELCHLIHMNHSKQFWQLVAIHYPKYSLAKKHLKDTEIHFQL